MISPLLLLAHATYISLGYPIDFLLYQDLKIIYWNILLDCYLQVGLTRPTCMSKPTISSCRSSMLESLVIIHGPFSNDSICQHLLYMCVWTLSVVSGAIYFRLDVCNLTHVKSKITLVVGNFWWTSIDSLTTCLEGQSFISLSWK